MPPSFSTAIKLMTRLRGMRSELIERAEIVLGFLDTIDALQTNLESLTEEEKLKVNDKDLQCFIAFLASSMNALSGNFSFRVEEVEQLQETAKGHIRTLAPCVMLSYLSLSPAVAAHSTDPEYSVVDFNSLTYDLVDGDAAVEIDPATATEDSHHQAEDEYVAQVHTWYISVLTGDAEALKELIYASNANFQRSISGMWPQAYMVLLNISGVTCDPTIKNEQSGKSAAVAIAPWLENMNAELRPSLAPYVRFLLARYYQMGLGVTKSPLKAFPLMQLAAESGLAVAQKVLGDMLREGDGVAKDLNHSAVMYQRATDQGDASAMCHLGEAYYYGKGVERSMEEAMRLYRRSYELGHSFAYYKAAKALRDGSEADKLESVRLLLLGAERGSSWAMVELGNCYAHHWGVEFSSTEALKWYEKAAKLGNGDAHFYLGHRMYHQGKRNGEMFHHFEFSAKKGSKRAQYYMGVCFEKGYGAPVNPFMAVKCYRRSAEQSYHAALATLGRLCQTGEGIQRDDVEAVRYLRLAAEHGSSSASFQLAKCLEEGKGININLEAAAAIYLELAVAGNKHAQFAIARCYESGLGVAHNDVEATRFYEFAAAQGHAGARQRIANQPG